MDKIILDTNIFFNMQSGINLGTTTKEILNNFGEIIHKLQLKKRAEFFMPPKIVREFVGFFKTKEQQKQANKFLSLIKIKEPNKNKQIHATVLYKLIEDIKKRSYLGLKIGEEEIKNAMVLKDDFKGLDKKEFQIKTGVFIKKFRDRYKNATRHGFLDSVADLDLIILAKELDGFLTSSDEGVVKWGRVFGVKELPPKLLGDYLQNLLSD